MKKKILLYLFILTLCLSLIGCKKEEKIENEWKFYMNENDLLFDENTQKIFDDGIKDYNNGELKPVALLGEQVVAGTNYMFLCESDIDGNKTYKVVIIYKDLEGNSHITYVNDFDVKKYVNETVNMNKEILLGGWHTKIPGKINMLDEKIQSYFDKSIEQITDVTYYPIAVLAEQENTGFNYAILCYGKLSDQNATNGVFVLTLYVDKTSKPEIVSISAVDLKYYNK